MILIGVILLIVGAVVASMSADRTIRMLGIIAAVIGLVLILFGVFDGTGGDLDVGGNTAGAVLAATSFF